LNFCSKLNSQTSKIESSDIETLRTYGEEIIPQFSGVAA